jgi:hypothetical protein
MRAMRGGGSQFGIVTKFTLRTYPVTQIWSGVRSFNATKEEYYEALQEYIANFANHPKAATLLTLGAPRAGAGMNGLLSGKGVGGIMGGLFGAKGSKLSRRDVTTEAAAQMALESFSGYHIFDKESLAALKETHRAMSESSTNAPDQQSVRSSWAVPLLYEGEKPKPDAWGKKFEALPFLGESGKMLSYDSLVSELVPGGFVGFVC